MFQCRCTIYLLFVISSLANIANGLTLHVAAISEAAATSQSKRAADTGTATATAQLRRQLQGNPDPPQIVSATPDSNKGEQTQETVLADGAATNPPTSPATNDKDAAAATTKAASTEDDTKAAATKTEITNPPSTEKETDEPSKICSRAITCDECKTAAKSVETETKETDTCVFNGDENATAASIVCQLLPKKDALKKLDDMCLPQDSSQKEAQNSEDDDSGGGGFSFVAGLFLVTVASVAFYRFKKGKLRFAGDGIVNDFTSVMSGTRAPYHKTETAPLATTSGDDDEEWGWEDSTHNNLGHLEMSNKKDDEDLTMAFAMSTKGLSRAAPKSSPVFSRAPPVALTSTSSSGSGPSASMSSFTPSAMHITSLGVPTSSSAVPKKKPIKKQEDDLFASMGLAAKPTFSATTSSSAATKAPPSRKSSDLIATDLMSVDAKWDDDGDLDDLLDD